MICDENKTTPVVVVVGHYVPIGADILAKIHEETLTSTVAVVNDISFHTETIPYRRSPMGSRVLAMAQMFAGIELMSSIDWKIPRAPSTDPAIGMLTWDYISSCMCPSHYRSVRTYTHHPLSKKQMKARIRNRIQKHNRKLNRKRR